MTILDMYAMFVNESIFLNDGRKAEMIETARKILDEISLDGVFEEYQELLKMWLLVHRESPFVSLFGYAFPELESGKSAAVKQWAKKDGYLIIRLAVEGYKFFEGTTDPNVYTKDFIIRVTAKEFKVLYIGHHVYDDMMEPYWSTPFTFNVRGKLFVRDYDLNKDRFVWRRVRF